jgi:RNA polymerase sigma-70 factor (ECF subfamily)
VRFGEPFLLEEASGISNGKEAMTSPGVKLRLVSDAVADSPNESGERFRPRAEAAPRPEAAPQAAYEELTLEALYEQYASFVGAMASRILGRAVEVDDVVQDVFASAVRSLKRREDAREIRSWLAKVTVRRCVRQLRFRRLWGMVDLAPQASYERLADPAAGPEERQLLVEVYRALDRLPARDRVAWTLRNVEGETLERVAALCGCSLATVKRRIASAHDRLLRELKGRAL